MAEVKGMSLFKKTGLLAFCLFGIISTLASALTAWTLYERMTQEYISKGSAIATSIAGASQEILLVRDAATVQSMIDQYLEIEGVSYVFVVDGDRLLVSHTFVPEMPRQLRGLEGAKHEQVVTELDLPDTGSVIDICVPILVGVAGYVHVGMDKELIMGYFWEVVIEMQALLFSIFWVCVGILYLVTRRISRPLHHLTEYARKLAAHEFNASINIKTGDELEVLGRSMQSMGQELALLFSEMESEVDKATGDLRDHMAYLSSIIDNLVDGLLVVGVNGELTVINPAMREFFELGEVDFRGSQVSEVFSGEIVEMSTGVRNCSDEILSAEISLARGRIGQAIGSSIIVKESDACFGGVILVRDITREKELDQLKTDFISTVSHELRTPMTSVLGFAKIIKKKLENSVFPHLDDSEMSAKPVEQVRKNMGIIVTEAERLTELINDVLDIARMEAGEIQWREQKVSMEEVVRQSRMSTKGMWKAKGLDVVLDIAEDLPFVQGDYDRLVQVVVNLISNSIKFTEQGPITCSVALDGNSVRVSVADKGDGIGAEDVSLVFEKFKQVGDTLTGKPAGTGLGLPICRQIVEFHGGRIWVDSVQGEGSTFSFTIPLEHGRVEKRERVATCSTLLSEDVEVKPRAKDDPPLILVVDDDPSLREYLEQVFSDLGFLVHSAACGEDAITLATELLPDLITMDIMMPGMDGHEAIGCLRGGETTRSIPILVLSALSGMAGKGGDLTLTKPVDDTSLVKAARLLLKDGPGCTSCLVMGDKESVDLNKIATFCYGDIEFSMGQAFWDKLDAGYEGTVFVPSDGCSTAEMERLICLSEVSVVILPADTSD